MKLKQASPCLVFAAKRKSTRSWLHPRLQTCWLGRADRVKDLTSVIFSGRSNPPGNDQTWQKGSSAAAAASLTGCETPCRGARDHRSGEDGEQCCGAPSGELGGGPQPGGGLWHHHHGPEEPDGAAQCRGGGQHQGQLRRRAGHLPPAQNLAHRRWGTPPPQQQHTRVKKIFVYYILKPPGTNLLFNKGCVCNKSLSPPLPPITQSASHQRSIQGS